MNEREKLFKAYYAMIARTVDSIATMSEAKVLNMLRTIQANRSSYNQTLAFLHSVAIPPAEDSEPGVDQLRSELSAKARSGDQPLEILNYIEDALKKRLETLKREGK